MFNARPWNPATTPPIPIRPTKSMIRLHGWRPVYIPGHYNSTEENLLLLSQEWRREKNPSTVSPQNVPSDAERSGDFTALCASILQIVHRTSGDELPITPTATGRRSWPSYHSQYTAGGFPAVSSIVSTPTTWREELIRIDHNLTETIADFPLHP